METSIGAYFELKNNDPVMNHKKLLESVRLDIKEKANSDNSDKLNEILRKAELNDPEAQFELARMYEKGDVVPQDYLKSFELYIEAGWWKDRKYKKPLEWFENIAEHGNAQLKCFIGYMYENSIRTSKNYKKAWEWYKKAFYSGNKEAEKQIISLFSRDKIRNEEIIKIIENAANLGDIELQYRVGTYYEDIENYEEAFEWYHKAAVNGSAEAQRTLGSIYEYGELYGWEIHDIEKAKEWYKKSADQGNKLAIEAFDRIKNLKEENRIVYKCSDAFIKKDDIGVIKTDGTEYNNFNEYDDDDDFDFDEDED